MTLSLGTSAVRSAPLLDYRTSWMANTYGDGNGTWAQNDIRGMALADDGTVYTNTPWDESGAEVSAYKDGRVVAVGEHTHGWGNAGGDAIAINDRYVFTAANLNNEGGSLSVPLPYTWPPKGKNWYGVVRRLRSDITQGASFAGGVGNLTNTLGRSFLIVNDADHDGEFITGLAATDSTLFVSNGSHDEVRVYDAHSMQFERRWSVPNPGKIAVDKRDGTVWVVSLPPGAAASVAHFSADGERLTGDLPLPAGTVPSDVSSQVSGQLVVADSGVAQQVLVFTFEDGAYRLSETLGTRLGIYAAPIGIVGPWRFDGLTGAAIDAAGNLTVTMNGQGARPPEQDPHVTIYGASVQRYGADHRLQWQVEAQAFVSGIAVDPKSPETLYSGTRRFHFDYDKQDDQAWRDEATLLNRFQFPPESIETGMLLHVSPFYRYLDGKPFLFSLSQTGDVLSIYRFDPAKYGTIAVPSGYLTWTNRFGINKPKDSPAGGMWRDVKGDGRFDAAEWQQDPSPEHLKQSGTSWWPDTHGDLWLPLTTDGIRRIPFHGLDAFGNPVYRLDDTQTFPLPAPFARVQRLEYDARTDTMYVAGYTPKRKYDNGYWMEIGDTFARYDHWLKGKGGANASSHGVRQPRYVISLPWNLDAHPHITMIGFTVVGDYVFVITARNGFVNVYQKDNGAYVGQIQPGPEVGRTSGWVDTSNGITAYRRPNGEYVIFAEEDARAKFIVYRWTPRPLPSTVQK